MKADNFIKEVKVLAVKRGVVLRSISVYDGGGISRFTAPKDPPGPVGRPRVADYRSIIHLRKKGLSQYEIAKHLGCSRGAVEYALRLAKGSKDE